MEKYLYNVISFAFIFIPSESDDLRQTKKTLHWDCTMLAQIMVLRGTVQFCHRSTALVSDLNQNS